MFSIESTTETFLHFTLDRIGISAVFSKTDELRIRNFFQHVESTLSMQILANISFFLFVYTLSMLCLIHFPSSICVTPDFH